MKGSASIALCVPLLLLLPAAALAERSVWGYGVRSCADFLRARTDQGANSAAELQRYEDWLTGFVTGLNLATGEDVLRGSGIQAAMDRTAAYCKGKPDADFFNASMDFVRTLSSMK